MKDVSYALGLSIANNLISSGVKGLEVDEFTKAVKQVLAGEQPDVSYEVAKETLDTFFKDLSDKMNSKNVEAGAAFLAANKEKEGVITLESGLQYEIITEGTGAKPSATDQVECHYHGTLIDGTIFDSSVQRGEAATFGVNQVIPGWVEALQLMPEGSKWRLFIPSDLAYGPQGAGQAIPPHASLIFEVELLKIK